MIFLNDFATFGYQKAFRTLANDLANKQVSGQTLGQIGSKFGRKFANATRGKIGGIGRGLNKVRNEFRQTPIIRNGVSLTDRQRKASTRVVNNSGGIKSTATNGVRTFGNDPKINKNFGNDLNLR